MQKAKENFKIQLGITILGVVLFVAKMIAYYLTHSLAILTDALESIVNMLAGLISLYSLFIAAKPSDDNHPYGHGKAEFISAAVEGTLIVTAGIFIIYQTVYSFFAVNTIHTLDTGIIIIAITALLNFIAGAICIKVGNKNNSLALVAGGKHLQTDTYSTLAIIIGLIIMFVTKVFWLDKVIAFLVSFLILYNGYKIIRASVAGMMDEADEVLLSKLIEYINNNRKENWVDLHNLRVIKYGSLLHIDCHLTVPWYLNVHQAHTAIDELSFLIKHKFGDRVELFVHTDGCLHFSCSICSKQNCTERKRPFSHRVEWTLDNVLADKKHNSAI